MVKDEEEIEATAEARTEAPDRAAKDEPPAALASSAARLRQIVADNESRMQELQQFVRRLDELTGSLLSAKPEAPPKPPKGRPRRGGGAGG